MKRVGWASPLALILGLSLGVAYAWVIAPLRTVDTTPNTLRADFKDQFRTLIAASYAATHNLERARARLTLLGDADPQQALAAQAQRMLASGESFQVVQQVAQLAADLGSGRASLVATATATAAPATKPPLPIPTSTRLVPTEGTLAAEATATAPEASPSEAVTNTPALETPTARPTPTASAPFQLVSQDQVCNPNLTDGLMQVSVLDRRKHQMPGVEIDISWAGGQESFFTGLKPEIADGYADTIMQAGVIYSLRVGRTGDAVTNLTAPACPDSNGQTYVGGLKLVFQQP